MAAIFKRAQDIRATFYPESSGDAESDRDSDWEARSPTSGRRVMHCPAPCTALLQLGAVNALLNHILQFVFKGTQQLEKR